MDDCPFGAAVISETVVSGGDLPAGQARPIVARLYQLRKDWSGECSFPRRKKLNSNNLSKDNDLSVKIRFPLCVEIMCIGRVNKRSLVFDFKKECFLHSIRCGADGQNMRRNGRIVSKFLV